MAARLWSGMSASYHQLRPKFWTDPKVRAWDEATKLLALYILTGSGRLTEGLYRLPLALAASDLGWPVEDVGSRLERLVADGFVAFDPATDVLLIRKALKYQPPAGANNIKGALNAIDNVPESPLFTDFLTAAKTYAPEFARALQQKYPKAERGSERGSQLLNSSSTSAQLARDGLRDEATSNGPMPWDE